MGFIILIILCYGFFMPMPPSTPPANWGKWWKEFKDVFTWPTPYPKQDVDANIRASAASHKISAEFACNPSRYLRK